MRKLSRLARPRLDSDNLPRAVIDTLVAQTNANLPTLHRYFRLRGEACSASRPALLRHRTRRWSRVSSTFPLDEQRSAHARAALRPLGDDYVATIDDGLAIAGWTSIRGRASGRGAHGRRRVRRAPVPAAEPQRQLRIA